MSKPEWPFEVTVCWSAGWTVYLSGELDAASGSQLERVAGALAGARIAAADFDLGGVTFVDTAGWANLTAALSTVEASGALPRLRNLSRSVRRYSDAMLAVAHLEGRQLTDDTMARSA